MNRSVSVSKTGSHAAQAGFKLLKITKDGLEAITLHVTGLSLGGN